MAEVDIATLGVKVDVTGGDKAETQLDNLAKSGDRAEQSAKGVTAATSQMDATIRAAIAAITANTQATSSLSAAYERNKTSGRGAAEAADDMESRLARLRATIDPMGVAIDRVNQELAEARMLFEAGAMSADDYARSQVVLNARAADFARRQDMMNNQMGVGARSAKLQAHEMLNLSRQFADIGVTAAMGMNPLMILVQQGPQIADVLGTARARGIGVTAMFRQMGAAARPFLGVLTGIGVAAGIAFGGLALAARDMEKGVDTSLKGVQKEFGFTEAQMKRLKEEGTDLGFTMSDVFGGIADTVKEMFTETFADEIDTVSKWWNEFLDDTASGVVAAFKDIVGTFTGAFYAIKAIWSGLPAAFGDIVNNIVNIVAHGIANTVNKAIEGINSLIGMLPDWVTSKVLSPINYRMEVNELPTNGAAQEFFANVGSEAGRGYEAGSEFVDEFVGRAGGNIRDRRRDRIREAAGEPGKGRKPKKPRQSEEEKDWEKAVEGAENYIRALSEATEEIGKNQFEVKRLATARADAELKLAAEKAQLAGIADAMETYNRLAGEMAAETEKWIAATNAEAIKQFRIELQDEADALRFETKLIGMNAEERERAIKGREIDLRIMELEREGHYGVAEAIRAERNELVTLAGNRAGMQDRIDEAYRVADAHRDMADAVASATSSFGELFGTVGEGYSNVMTTMFDFFANQAEGQARLNELNEEYQNGLISTADYEHQRAQTQRQLAHEQIAVYGDMLGAAKTFFKEGSTGWRIMETAERAYRLFQFAMQIKAMLMDKAETANSVANSGARAAADGVAAVAKAIASLPFPFNIAAGAATLAFLVAIGVKMAKGAGGGAKGASQAASKASDAFTGPRDIYGNPTSAYSVLRPGATTVAGDPSQARWPSGGAPAAAGGGIGSFRGGDLIIQGGADRRTAEEMQQQFQEWSRRTVNDARQAAAADRAAQAQRQYIGGNG